MVLCPRPADAAREPAPGLDPGEGPDAKRREGEGPGLREEQREPPLIGRCYPTVIAADNPLFSRRYFAVLQLDKTQKSTLIQ